MKPKRHVRCDFILFGLCQTWFVQEPDLWLPGALVAKRRRARVMAFVKGFSETQPNIFFFWTSRRCDWWTLCYPEEHTCPAKTRTFMQEIHKHNLKKTNKVSGLPRTHYTTMDSCAYRNTWNSCSTSSAPRLECTKNQPRPPGMIAKDRTIFCQANKALQLASFSLLHASLHWQCHLFFFCVHLWKILLRCLPAAHCDHTFTKPLIPNQ